MLVRCTRVRWSSTCRQNRAASANQPLCRWPGFVVCEALWSVLWCVCVPMLAAPDGHVCCCAGPAPALHLWPRWRVPGEGSALSPLPAHGGAARFQGASPAVMGLACLLFGLMCPGLVWGCYTCCAGCHSVDVVYHANAAAGLAHCVHSSSQWAVCHTFTCNVPDSSTFDAAAGQRRISVACYGHDTRSARPMA